MVIRRPHEERYTAITLRSVYESACQLATGEHDQPSLKLALAAGILSANNRLERNGWQAQAMRTYMRQTGGKLPTSAEHVKHLTRRAGYECSIAQARAIVALEVATQRGELQELQHKPSNGHEWLLWRQAVARLPGLGYKTASFAALLLWPLESPLVPVDRHVIAWLYAAGQLQSIPGTSQQIMRRAQRARTLGYRTYRAIERIVGNERLRLGVPYSTAVYHWYRWEDWRQAIGVSTGGIEPESHRLLSAYDY